VVNIKFLNIFNILKTDNACNDLYDVGTGVFAGCQTVPGNQKLWKIELTVPTVIPALNNVRVRCKC
jgi:hypothetical protein